MIRTEQSAAELAQQIVQGHRRALARAITRLESVRDEDRKFSRQLLAHLASQHRRGFRVGVSGAPGVGKSSLLEQLGLHLIGQGQRPAVLAIDPTSQHNGGSVLADKTRMSRLSVLPDAFVRPSPSGAERGGIAETTASSLFVCECAGYSPCLVETVGVGQAETSVVSVVDLLVVLLEPGAGDELQGIKRGLLEWADVVVIHKADGRRQPLAQQSKIQYESALGLLRRQSDAPAVVAVSSSQGQGVAELWELVRERADCLERTGELQRRRQQQLRQQYRHTLRRAIVEEYLKGARRAGLVEKLEKDVISGVMSIPEAVHCVLTG